MSLHDAFLIIIHSTSRVSPQEDSALCAVCVVRFPESCWRRDSGKYRGTYFDRVAVTHL